MDAIRALTDDAHDLLEPNYARVVELQRTAGDKPEIANRKDDRLEYGLVGVIKWAINENIFSREGRSQVQPPKRRSRIAVHTAFAIVFRPRPLFLGGLCTGGSPWLSTTRI